MLAGGLLLMGLHRMNEGIDIKHLVWLNAVVSFLTDVSYDPLPPLCTFGYLAEHDRLERPDYKAAQGIDIDIVAASPLEDSIFLPDGTYLCKNWPVWGNA